MKRISASVFLVLFLGFSPPGARAQSDQTLEPVVVTATRIETPLEKITTSMTVITEKEIRDQQAESVLEVLRNVPGLGVVQSGSKGASTSLFIRGSNSNQVLVLIDGMKVNNVTAGNFNLAHLLTDNVERIEILRGAGGTLYGSNAVGGVINILTHRGKGVPQLNFSLAGGNGSTHQETFSFSGGTPQWTYSVTGSFLRTDGFHSSNDDYQNSSASAQLAYLMGDKASLSGSLWMTETRSGLFNSNNSSSAPDPNDRQEDQFLTGRLHWEQEPTNNVDYRLSLGLTQGHERTVTRVDSVDTSNEETRTRPRIFNPQFQINYQWHDMNGLTFGMDWEMPKADFEGIRRKQNNQALYLQNQSRFLGERLTFLTGVRLDHNEDFGQEWSPSASAAYRVRESGTKIKASYAESFRAPTFNDLFYPGFNNPNLRPEKGWEFNLGIEQRLWRKQLSLEVVYFHREVKDLIEFPGARPENVGQVIADGVEWILKWRLPCGISWQGNYTFLNMTDRLTRRPRHKGNITLLYGNGPFNVQLKSHIIGRRLDVDAVSFQTIDQGGYTRFDLASSYRLPWSPPFIDSLSLYGRIENLFDKQYDEADGFRAKPFNFLIGIRGKMGRD